MSWFELLKTLSGKDENWLADVGTDNTGLPAITPVTAQLPESPKRKKCPKDQRWCPKCGKCDSLEEWRKHNQGE